MRPPNAVLVLVIIAMGSVASCYRPAGERACEVACSFADRGGVCPSGLTCFDSPTGGVCRTEADSCTDVIRDAPATDDGMFCFGSPDGIIHGCRPSPPTASRSDLVTIDTSTSNPDCVTLSPTSEGGDDVCAIFAVDITFAVPTITARGPRPLVLVASHDITLAMNQTLSVANQLSPLHNAAGANSPHCPAATSATDAGAGGPGGSFHGRGGNGGGVGGGNPTEPGDVGTSMLLRGGCPGGAGQGSTMGNGGNSGGAIYLIAANQITIAGLINASGAGANIAMAGGNGGGSGGMIGLDAPTIKLTATGAIMANGGGGSSGANGTGVSAFGHDPAAPETPAPGGFVVGSEGLAGGSGNAATVNNGTAGSSVASGNAGGGGGGAGWVVVFPADQRAKLNVVGVSPRP